MHSAFRLLALWAASVAASATVQHHWFAAPLDAGFFLLAAVSAAVTLGLMEWLARARLARAEAEALRDQQIAFLVAEAVRQRRALDRVESAVSSRDLP